MSNVVKFPASAATETTVAEMLKYFPEHILDDLPFVDPEPPPRSDGQRRFSSRNCWNDIPTDSGSDDFARGKRYAKMTMAVMQAHSTHYGEHKLSISRGLLKA
jgi:hypothetical protein